MIDLTGKCGSCEFFKPNFPTASGWCKAQKYGDDVAHDPENPYRYVQRSRIKCKRYKPLFEPSKGVLPNGEV
jgi:hypothetical protein